MCPGYQVKFVNLLMTQLDFTSDSKIHKKNRENPMIGKTISRYKILSKIGEGGMGIVYKVEDENLKRQVALKFLPRELTRKKEAGERFIHEAQSASALGHQNVCTVHEIGKIDDGQMFIAMRYNEGETLKDKIAKGPLKITEAVDNAIQINR